MAKVLLETREEKNYMGDTEVVTDYLSLEPGHYNGVYKVVVKKETLKGRFTECLLFADGNFNIRVGTGRKSSKKLEKLENYLLRNKEELTNMWLEKKYQLMVNTISQDVVIEKLV